MKKIISSVVLVTFFSILFFHPSYANGLEMNHNNDTIRSNKVNEEKEDYSGQEAFLETRVYGITVTRFEESTGEKIYPDAIDFLTSDEHKKELVTLTLKVSKRNI